MTPTPVSQEAREAAAEFHAELLDEEYASDTRRGVRDNDTDVQRFARFESTIRKQERDQCAKVEWQDIATAPKDGTVILLSDGKNVEAGCFAPSVHGDEYPWAFVDDYTGTDLCTGYVGVPANAFRLGDVTHWMPLPEAPAIRKGSEA